MTPKSSFAYQGVPNTFAYDALKRLLSDSRLGIVLSNLYDPAGRVLRQLRKGTDWGRGGQI